MEKVLGSDAVSFLEGGFLMDYVAILFMEEGARFFSLMKTLRLNDERVLDQSILLSLKVLVLDMSVKSQVMLNVGPTFNQLSEGID